MVRGVRLALLFVILVALGESKVLKKNRNDIRKIPDNMTFGAATAAYQVEGAWNEDGKGENIWDRLTHTKIDPCAIRQCHTGDVANDSYHKYKRDVEMMRELGLDYYRFSLSWSRILPTSFPDKINEKGVEYYNNLINEMLKYNIKPLVTIYHWDLPQKLQEMGGWANPHIVDWYTDYARIVFDLFGDRVKSWITINEPREVCYQGYAGASLAPLYNISGYADYMCAKNLLVAHANVWHMYNNEYRNVLGGEIGITISARWYEPESEKDVEAAEDQIQFEWGIYANPVFSKNGDFPERMKKRVAEKSKAQGFKRSRLPEFTPEEVDFVRGTSDFFGLNHYTTSIVYRNASVNGYHTVPSFYDDIDALSYQDSEWPQSASSWLKTVPWGFYKLLTKIREDYNNPTVYVTENGFSSEGGIIDDNAVEYYRTYIDAMLDAIEEGSDVRRYTPWSLMDNFEWLKGYTERFGLYEVDYESPERTRTPRKSAYVYKEILRTRTLDFNYEPDMSVPLTIDDKCSTEVKPLVNLVLHISFTLGACIALSQCNSLPGRKVRKFPDGFTFGTATAAYQIEGAWNVDGKSENIWDYLTHTTPEKVIDLSNGDIAGNSYYLYKRDVEMMRELGLDSYRFSLSWTRILPTSFPDYINKAGVEYYHNLIDEMLKYNITPIVTVFHWDLPQKLQQLGGWTNSESVNWYTDYARIVFSLFGDKVKLFITINEPHQVCYFGYGDKLLAPVLDIKGVAEYMCMKNVLLAHAKAYHIYNEEFRPTQKGKIFISLSAQWHEPATVDDEAAARDARQFYWGVYAHPVFSKTGNFPAEMRERIAIKSAAQGFRRSRLPEFTPEEIELVRGTSDYFGLNHYSSSYVYRNESSANYYTAPSFYDDLEVITYQLPEWKIGSSNYTKYVPWGFRKLINFITNEYDSPPIFITENGFATNGGIEDEDRTTYYKGYIDAVLDAIDDGCDVRAYTAWSLMDNFEWLNGYKERFGLYEIDFNDPERPRTPRKSAYVFKEIIRTRTVDLNYEPDMSKPMTIDDGK